MKRRLLSAFLAVMMVLTMAPVAFAADDVVAKIGDISYSTLADAVVHAKTGDTIVMQSATDISKTGLKITSGKDITLDLNGHEVKAANTQAGNIQVAGKMTLKDSTDTNANGEGEGKITTSSTYVYGSTDKVLVTALDGEFVMESGLIDAATNITDNKNNGQFAVGVENQNKNASVTINGGKIKAGWYAVAGNGGYTSYSGDITVNGGILESTTDYAIFHPHAGTTTINGGVIYGQAGGIAIKRGKLVVNDGMITSKGIGSTGSWGDGTGNLNNAAIHANAGYGDVSVSIKGGKVTAEGNAVTIDKGTAHTATIAISGGTFSSDISKYCEKNYYTEQNEDHTYTVKSLKDVAVAQIGDTYYKTLAEAYAALPRNAGTDSEPTTITVLKDSEGKAIGSDSDKGMNYVIDFGGHTYTVGKPAVGSTGTETQGLRVLKGSKAVFKNGTLKAVNYPDMKMPVHTYGDVTFQDFTVDATEDSYAQIAYEIDNGSLNMIGNSSILAYPGKIGLYVSFWPRGGYTDGTTVNIDTTGKITGKMVYEWDDKADTAEQQKENKAVLNITNGYFDITGIQTLFTSTIPSELKVTKISISGGYFTTDPSAYVASGYVAGTSDVSGYSYKVVAKTNTGSVEVKPDVADPEVKVSGSISKEDQAKVAAAAATVSAPTLGAAAVDEAQKINEDKAKELLKDVNVGDGDKKLYVQSSLKVEPTAYNETTKTLALEITPQYRIVASTAATADDIELGDNGNAQVVQDYTPMNITKATVVTMELPAGFAVDNGAKLSIQHTKSNGTVEYYTGTVTKKDDKLYLTFTTNGFSPFVISVPAASIGENVYPTLQAAVDSVKNNETIKLAQDVAVSDVAAVTVTANKTFKIDTTKDNSGTYVFDAEKNIVAGNRTSIAAPTKEGNVYMYTCTYNKPSSGGSSGGSSSGKTTYKVTTSAVNNGGVNASPSSAEKGAAITITLSPDKGYKLDKLTVTDGSGKTVSTVKKSDTVYTFTMPASAVKVGVSYVKATETPSETKFNDVSANDWFASAVDYVTGKGMMNGTADNTFSPKANTTRGMVVTVLYRLENQPSTSAASFTDVASGAYYANAVAWANANGIVSGYGSGKFGPNDKVTREQLAAILYRYAQYKKYDVSVGEDTNILSYDDAQSISSYAIPAIQWACGAGVVTGKSGSKLDPKGNATRAEVAAMLMRFCENVK